LRDDLVLIHAPSVYDFRKRSLLYGPISDVIPSTPVFEMYPIGFATISGYLHKRGMNVRIVNLAVRMLSSPRFDAEAHLKRYRPVAFGLDLHWFPHVQGVLEVASILKRLHPDVPVILGGLSASYFHREILENYPQIDYVVRGDCAEEPLARLITALKGGGDPSGIPNVSFRRGEVIHEGAIDWVPDSLDSYPLDYRHMMRQVFRHRDPIGHAPFKDWFSYPITAVLTCKGCNHHCVTCGGSCYASKKVVNRDQPVYKDPQAIAREVGSVTPYLTGPIFFLGDFLEAGDDYCRALVAALRPLKIKNQVVMEFFSPPDRGFLEELASAIPNFNIEISPESHDETVRRAFGRPYGNAALETFLADAAALGCGRTDLFFMTGLPEQTHASAVGTVDYCRGLLERHGKDGRVVPFISPLAPFVDPGSMVFEDPAAYGYDLRFRTVEEHRQGMLSLSWKGMLNYETRWMNRDEIVDSTYLAGIGLTKLKAEYGILPQAQADAVVGRADRAMGLMTELEAAESLPPEEMAKTVESLRRRVTGSSESSVCQKRELTWTTGLLKFKHWNIAKLFLSGNWG
jgi:B12-binding domain/radical SAM domain protein